MSGKTKRQNSRKSARRKCKKLIYFDNNGTTVICDSAKKLYIKWIECYNASTDSHLASPARSIIETSTNAVLSHCGVSKATHTVVYTSGASESNCAFLRMCVKAYAQNLKKKGIELLPHIIASAIEHTATIECLEDLVAHDQATVTYIKPRIYGNILVSDIEPEIRENTGLITVMYANNEIPALNNIKAIGALAHKYNIPFHSDCVQVFGKYICLMDDNNMDALSCSAHKFYGPKGVGLLIIKNELIDGYGLTAEINGSQQKSLRGGTLNAPGIVSMMGALKYSFTNRRKKNKKLFALRNYLIDKLSKIYTTKNYDQYIFPNNPTNQSNQSANQQGSKSANQAKQPTKSATQPVSNLHEHIKIYILGPPKDKEAYLLPNTVLLSVCKEKGVPFCNVDLKHFLDKKGIIISIGSACSTHNSNASHVLEAMECPPVIKRGIIRISFNDSNTTSEINTFVECLQEGIEKQTKDLKKKGINLL